MTIMLEIDDPLASILQTAAMSRQLTATELAKRLLADALGEKDGNWDELNRRRIELIRKGNREGLSAAEADELQQLQDAADQRLEQVDLQLLDQLNRFRDAVDNLPLKESAS